jgi:hypothetical protein
VEEALLLMGWAQRLISILITAAFLATFQVFIAPNLSTLLGRPAMWGGYFIAFFILLILEFITYKLITRRVAPE